MIVIGSVSVSTPYSTLYFVSFFSTCNKIWTYILAVISCGGDGDHRKVVVFLSAGSP